jgi:hypothetical protein
MPGRGPSQPLADRSDEHGRLESDGETKEALLHRSPKRQSYGTHVGCGTRCASFERKPTQQACSQACREDGTPI